MSLNINQLDLTQLKESVLILKESVLLLRSQVVSIRQMRKEIENQKTDDPNGTCAAFHRGAIFAYQLILKNIGEKFTPEYQKELEDIYLGRDRTFNFNDSPKIKLDRRRS